jgi:hypothetical protein
MRVGIRNTRLVENVPLADRLPEEPNGNKEPAVYGGLLI